MMIIDALRDIPDPRASNCRHDLAEILFVCVAGALLGARSACEISLIAENRLELFRRVVPLEHGAPSHDTISRVLRLVDPKRFEAAFQRFMKGYGEEMGRQAGSNVVAVDGKSMRRAYERGRAHMPPVIVSILSCATRMTLAQKASGAGGEAAAAVEMLEFLSLKGAIVTADAAHCSQKTTETIRKSGGDYCIAIKKNQSNLYKEAEAALAKKSRAARTFEETTSGHDRLEVRRATVIPFEQTLGKRHLAGLVAIGCVTSERAVAGKKATTKTRIFALSKRLPPSELIDVTRQHWRIESAPQAHTRRRFVMN